MAKVVRPFGITKTRIDADKTLTREKINVEPGENAWDTLQNAAEANGLWPWFSPDGTLIIGRPDYSQPPVATLKMKREGGENNLVSLSESRDISRRFSEVTVLGQSHGTDLEPGKHNVKATVKDSGLTWHRPKILTDHESDSLAVASARGRKFIADARLNGYTLTASVSGHAVDMSAAKPLLWTPGQRVHVVSEPHGIDATFFVMARRFTGGRNQPARTVLSLKEDGVWQLEAHPHTRRRRRGKNSTPGAVVDVAGAPA
jgi:prophage tail gpP-like protein